MYKHSLSLSLSLSLSRTHTPLIFQPLTVESETSRGSFIGVILAVAAVFAAANFDKVRGIHSIGIIYMKLVD